MNQRLAKQLLQSLSYPLTPPGCSSHFVPHPYYDRKAVEIAIVQEHRFAFFYWLKWRFKDGTSDLPPDLVTIDWHDDVGGECDFNEQQLKKLDPSDENELSLFCWAGLRSLNDGHVAPALYLDAIGDVHAIIRQDWGAGVSEHDRRSKIVDRHGRSHTIRYYRSPATFMRTNENGDNSRSVIVDLDLDYFTRQHSSDVHGRQIRLPDSVVRKTLEPSAAFMQTLLPRLAGVTIATEPEHCGGMANCLHILGVVNEVLFNGSLLSAEGSWRLGGKKSR
jgi:hypothetical protein